MKFILDIVKGVIIGLANIVPGVSGGTMAVSMNIYDKLIYAITHLFQEFKNSIKILLPYGIGMALGIIGLSFFIEFLYAQYPIQTNCIFIGLIMGGVPAVASKVKNKTSFAEAGIFLLFFLAIIILHFLGGEGDSTAITMDFLQVLLLFFIGMIASATMIIPGVSGSMILMLLGYYHPIIETINSTVKALLALDIQGVLSGAAILFPFGLGIVVGIFAIAKAIEILLRRYEIKTYCGILGLVIASPVVLLMNMDYSAVSPAVIIASAICLAAGFLVPAKLLSKLG